MLQYSKVDYIAEYLGYKAISRSSWPGFVIVIVAPVAAALLLALQPPVDSRQ